MTSEQKGVDVPAFPVTDYSAYQYSGMGLRDYFAAKVLQAGFGYQPFHADYAQRAKSAYELADAMLAARGRP